MTVTELARQLGIHIAQGRGDHQVALFQWEHAAEGLTEVLARDEAGLLELYSGTVPGAVGCASPVVDDLGDLIGADDYEDLI